MNKRIWILLGLLTAITTPLLAQTVVGTLSQPGMKPYSVAVYEAGNKIFVADDNTGNLHMYDGATDALLSSVFIGGKVNSMVVHESSGKLYAASLSVNKIAVVNAATGAFLTYLAGTYANTVSPTSLRIEQGLGKVYALSLEGLTQIDVATNSETIIPGFGGGGFEEMEVNPVTHEVFVVRYIQNVLEIVDGVTLAKTTVPSMRGLDIGVNWTENKAYIATGTAGSTSFRIYDRDTGVTDSLVNVNDATEFAFHSINNRIYSNAEVNGYSTIIEGPSNAYFNLPMLSGASAIEIRLSTNHLYYAGTKFIGIVDDATQMLELIPVNNPSPSNPVHQAIAINQTTGRVYVINDNNTLNFVTVIQDTEMMTRPPVHLGSIGFPAKLHVIDPVSRQVVDTWTSPSSFQDDHAMAVRPGGGRVYAPHVSAFTEELQLYAGAGSKVLLTKFSDGGNDSRAIAFKPDGSRFYVTNSGSDNVSVMNATNNTIVTTVSAGDMPWGIAVSPDGAKAYVANNANTGTGNSVSVINTATNTVVNTIAVGTGPYGVAINPAGTKLFVANSGAGTVSVIDLASETVMTTVTVGTTPHWLACTADGKRVYVGNRGSDTVSIIDTGTNAVIQTLTGFTNPEGLGVMPDNSEVFVVNSSTGISSVSVINNTDFSTTNFTLPSDAKETISLTIEDPSSKFAGRVTSGGAPINNAFVRALQGGVEKGTATTNASGDYAIFNLKSGTYDVEASASGYVTQTQSGQSVGLGRITLVNFNLNEVIVTNPVPQISQPLVPTSATPGASQFTLTVRGSNFVAGAVVRWNGANRTTTFVSSTVLQAEITPSDLASAGTAVVTVFNPTPAGGLSNSAFFHITNSLGTVAFVRTDFATGTAPRAVTTADFNSDVKLDLATANANSNTVSILLGNGDGTFGPKSDHATGQRPFSLTSGDFNGDQAPDLAIANFDASTVSILLGVGNGTFLPKNDFATGTNPETVLTADFNRDGKLDLATTDPGANALSILLGNGDGTFAPHSDFATGTFPRGLTTGDFNADGKLDLVNTNESNANVSVFLGNGDGTFGARTDFATGVIPNSVATADCNSDGKLDLAVASSASDAISVLLGNGDGTFGPKTNFSTGDFPFWVITGDFNADNKIDLAVSNAFSNTVSFFLGNGNGTFSPKADFITGTQPETVAPGDFDRDGKLDLATANVGDNTASVLLNRQLTLSINDVSVTEGNSGTINAIFTVTLSAASSQIVTVDYATADGSATTAGNDYIAKSGTVTFPANSTTPQTITIMVNSDTEVEPDENFFVNLSNAVNATIMDAQGIGTIINDDASSAQWTQQTSGTTNNLRSVHFVEANNGWTVGFSNTILRTTNGGANWSLQNPNNSQTQNYLAVRAIDANIVWAGAGLAVLRTTDAGATWNSTEYNSTPTLFRNSLFPVSATVAWAPANDTGVRLFLRYTVQPDGITLVQQSFGVIGSSAVLRDIYFIDQDNGWSVGSPGQIVRITNASTASPSFANQTSGTTVQLNGIYMLDANTGWIAGNGGIILKTTSSGSSWTALNSGTTTNLNDVHFNDLNNGWVVGDNGLILTTSDGGNSWTSEISGVTTILRSVYFASSGYATGDNGVILKRTTGAGGTTSVAFATASSSVMENAGSMTVNVALTTSDGNPSSSAVSVNYETADGSAIAGSDYTFASGTVNFPAGSPNGSTQTIEVPILDDPFTEPSETFTITLSNPVGGSLGSPSTHTVTINDNDSPAPSISINDVSVTEGNSGTTNAIFTISLSVASSQVVTVDFATADGTATAGSDYVGGSGTLTFNSGETSKTVTIGVIGDVCDEPDETFFVNLSNPTNATITDNQGLGTIIDDDPLPSLTIDDATVNEANTLTVIVFTVTMSNPSCQTVCMDWSTADGSATAGSDYGAGSGGICFLPGTTSGTLSIPINVDFIDEPDETFFLNLSNPSNAILADNQGQGTIIDDDPPPSISISDVTVTEGNAGTVNAILTVTLSAVSGKTVTVGYSTADGTATAPSDYVAAFGTLTFNPGETTKNVPVTVNGDVLFEPNETFLVNLSNPINATIADAQGQGTISNDDRITLNPTHDAYVRSDQPGNNFGTATTLRMKQSSPIYNSYLKFVVSGVSGPVQSAKVRMKVTVASSSGGSIYSVSNNKKNSSSPWTETNITYNNAPPISGTPWDTEGSVTVGQIVEFDVTPAIAGNGTFSFGLNNASTTTVQYSSKEGATKPELVIQTGPGIPSLSINDVTVTEGNSGTVNAVFSVSLSAASTQVVTVDYATANGTATAGSDYISGSGTVTFPPGTTTQPVTVAVIGDAVIESNETFLVNLSNATNATIGDAQGQGMITDDDAITITLNPTDDAFVNCAQPTTNFGTATTLRMKQSSPIVNSYLKFVVSGVSGAVLSAKLRMKVTVASSSGGSVFSVSNNLQSGSPWTELIVNCSNAPIIGGTPLDTEGSVTVNQIVEFDVTPAITGNGTFSFGLNNASTTMVQYSSKEGATKPELVIQFSTSAVAKIAADASRSNRVELAALPETFSLAQNYPNPFNAQTVVEYALPEQSKVRLIIYNLMGQVVRRLVDENQPAGYQRVIWNGRNEFGAEVSSGVYFLQLNAGRQKFVRKMFLQQ